MSTTSAPASASAFTYSVWSRSMAADHFPTSSGHIMDPIATASAPSAWPVSVSGATAPAMAGSSSCSLLMIDTASIVTASLPDDTYSEGSMSGTSDRPSVMWSTVWRLLLMAGIPSLPFRSTSHPRASASPVTQNGTLADSNPKISAWALPSLAIFSGSECASGQDAPHASIWPYVAD